MLAFLLCAILGGAVIAGAFVLAGATWVQGLIVYVLSCSLIALFLGILRAIIAHRKSRNCK